MNESSNWESVDEEKDWIPILWSAYTTTPFCHAPGTECSEAQDSPNWIDTVRDFYYVDWEEWTLS